MGGLSGFCLSSVGEFFFSDVDGVMAALFYFSEFKRWRRNPTNEERKKMEK